MRTSLRTSTLLTALALVLGACGDSQDQNSSDSDPFSATEQGLTSLATPCAFNTSTGVMTVTVATGETAILSKRASDSAVLQNGAQCDNKATSSTLKKITVNGSTGDETVILDFTNGVFAAGTSSATSGIAVDMKAGTGDVVGLRGTSGNDSIVFGISGVNLNGDKFKDITIAGAESYVVSLGSGDDSFTAGGSTETGAAFTAGLTLYGGAGNDTFDQGTASTPGEIINGGAGTDTVTYASRTAPITVDVGTGADDGAASENDSIATDVEVVTGGKGNDTLTADSATAITLNGGTGNDVLVGSSAVDTLNGDDGNDTLRGLAGNDVLNGGAGDDTFDEGTAANGSDAFNGGAGEDTVDYSARATNGVTVTMDGLAANDGETGENDNVGADVEGLIGTSHVDAITGNALNNTIRGGDGNDALNGGSGDDTFLMEASSDGDDVIVGGAGIDTVDYSARANDLTLALDGTVNSGESGEADTLGADVENAYGGDGDDTITGNASANELVGGLGDDILTGLAGDDVLEGGGGAEGNQLICGLGDGDIGFGEGSGTGHARTGCEF
jgi:Ca2+-binding RTX toxin-like protein